jgi:hypothetical protein
MLRESLMSLTVLAALAAPAMAGDLRQAGVPASTQPCATHVEGKAGSLAVVGHACNARSDVPRSDGRMSNGLLPNPQNYG